MITPRPRQAKAIEDLRSAYLFGHRLGCLDLAKAQLIQEHMEDEDE